MSPYAPAHPCSYPGCHELVVVGSRCILHRKQEMREYNKRRGSSTVQGYGIQWQRARRTYLAEHPLCVQCRAEGLYRAASVVDHIRPHRGDHTLFWSEDNWQALCKAHHDSKTATQDGRWGNRGERTQ